MRTIPLLSAILLMTTAPGGAVAQGRAPAAAAPGTPVVARPQLGVAVPVLDTHKVSIGGAEITIYRPSLIVSLAWSGTGTSVTWRWQVADQPFAPVASLTPPGLLASGDVAPGSFSVNFGTFPPLGEPPGRLGRPAPAAPGSAPVAGERTAPDVARTFYIRIFPVQNGQIVGAPSNTVVVRYAPGANPSLASTRGAIAAAEKAKAEADAERVAREVFVASIASFRPAVFADPNKWGCVTVVKNPYAGKLEGIAPHSLFAYPAGHTYCGQPYRGGSPPGFWDYAGAWLVAYEGLASFYDDAKSWVADKVASLVPCALLGKSAAQTCHDATAELAGAAISAGLAAAGVPPSIPKLAALEDAAKGQIVNGAVGFTCDAIKEGGGECTPEMRAAFQQAYRDAISKLQVQMFREAHEPGCGNEKEAHMNGVEPLPCFTSYPGTEVHPGPGSVYEPPVAVVRIRRVKPNPPKPLGRCRVHLEFWVHNHFNGGYLQGANIGPTDMDGEPYQDVYGFIPPLGPGQSVDVPLLLTAVRPFSVPGHFGTPAPGMTQDWHALYHGGQGKVLVHVNAMQPGSVLPSTCGIGATLAVQLQ